VPSPGHLSFEIGHGRRPLSGLGWRLASAMFDRERLITATR
jgi:hypothetical protein